VKINEDEDAERAELYRLFSDLFMREPTEETLLRAKELFQMKLAASPDELQRDFARIFLSQDLHPSPYESLYNFSVGEKPRLWGKATEEVNAFYEASGLFLDEETNPVPDHLALELLFMNYLIQNGLVEQQGMFLKEHLFWVPEYCDEVQKHAATPFYREVAKILKEFMLSEQERYERGLSG
jgi:anaerobic sulfite reductase subunit A